MSAKVRHSIENGTVARIFHIISTTQRPLQLQTIEKIEPAGV